MLPMQLTGGGVGSPFDGLLGLRDQIDRIFSRAYDEVGLERGDRHWSIPVDLVETDDAYRFTFEVPGFARDDLDVTLDSGFLTVSGHRPAAVENLEDEERKFRHMERRFGRFSRTLRLPGNASVDEVDAVCENGVLTVTVPKRADARPRRIPIGTERRRKIAGAAA